MNTKNSITAIIEINKDKIFDEIAKRTSYIGAKSKDDKDYDRIFVSDENEEFFETIFNLAHSECKEFLFQFTKEEMFPDFKQEADTIDGVLQETSDYNITLSLPKHFSHTTITLLTNLINEYITCRLLSEWIMITQPESHVYWIERCSMIKKQISIAMTSRTEPLRRTLRPF